LKTKSKKDFEERRKKNSGRKRAIKKERRKIKEIQTIINYLIF
jgi:hypothetical protein